MAATALNTDDIGALVVEFGERILPIQLDVTQRQAAQEAVVAAHRHFGRLDVVLNNAGFGYVGMIEEFTPDQVEAQFDVNFFGSLWIIQAALPLLRAQGSGRILQVSSIGGVTAYPIFGMYNASKWAVEGMITALAGEVEEFGISVTLIEPVGYATEWWGGNMRRTAELPDYSQLRRQTEANWTASAAGRSDPRSSAPAILAIADAEHPPLRVLLGDGGVKRVTEEYQRRIAGWQQWETILAAIDQKGSSAT